MHAEVSRSENAALGTPQLSLGGCQASEVASRGTQCDSAHVVARSTQVNFIPQQVTRGTQVQEVVETLSRGTQVQEAGFINVDSNTVTNTATEHNAIELDELLEDTLTKMDTIAQKLGLPTNHRSLLPEFVHSCQVSFQWSGDYSPHIHGSTKSWSRHYSALSFLLNGHLHAEYERISGMLGLPSCSHTTWHKIVTGLEEHVTELAEWSCSHVRDMIKERGDHMEWVASFDGFYLTRGHYSNNCSATIHDHTTGDIAWFCHRTKRGPDHNWEGTSGGAEGDMFEEIMGRVKAAGFVVQEVITDKDSSMNAIFCKHFPEGTITYCSNHCAKTMHKDLQKVKQFQCEVKVHTHFACKPMHLPPMLQCKAAGFKCKRMAEPFLGSCKAALNNLISSEQLQASDNPFRDFSAGILNFHQHYCLDIHSSPWCHHEKV